MASLTTYTKGDRRIHRIQFFDAARKRRGIRLDNVTDEFALDFKRKVEALVEHKATGKTLHYKIAKWVRDLDRSHHDKLAAVGLLEHRLAPGQVTVARFCDDYIRRKFDVKWSTRILYGNVRRNLVEHFGADRPLESITPSEADDWRRWLARPKNDDEPKAGGQGLAVETVRQRCRIAKQIFRDAERRKLIDDSPFADMKGVSSKGNREKDYFVTREEADKVLKACPDSQWKLVFALARYGGVRCPSEVLSLRWGDVDWQRGRVTIHSPKTEHHEGKESRVMPLFPELQPYLQAVWDELPEDFDATKKLTEQPVVTRWRTTEVNLRKRLHMIIERAGLKPWPKAFVALRSTRRTELEEQFPSHVVNVWIGHSQRIAERHYLQVTDAHFEAATAPRDPKECTNAVHVRRPEMDSNAAPSRTTSQSSKNLRSGTTRSKTDGRNRT